MGENARTLNGLRLRDGYSSPGLNVFIPGFANAETRHHGSMNGNPSSADAALAAG